MKENCNGDYVSIDPQNTKCVSDYEAYSEVSINSLLLDMCTFVWFTH